MVSFESFVTVSCSPSIVTMAVSLANSEIFSVKEWPDLEIWVWGRSIIANGAVRESAIVTIALSCIICELFDVG